MSEAPIADGALAVAGEKIISVGTRAALLEQFPDSTAHTFTDAAIIPGLVNVHSHLELTAMRGYLEAEESDFFAWLRKLTVAKMERMTADDLYVSAAWGACEALRAGVTSLGDASDSGFTSMRAMRDAGMRGIVFQESFGPDPRLATENFETLRSKVAQLRELETSLVRCGVSPHAPYTVCAPQLEMIARFASDERLPLMMHAAETRMEELFMRDGEGPFAAGLRGRGIEWQAPGISTVQYLQRHGVLEANALLAHCIHVDDKDLTTLAESETRVAHCSKSNAKLGHGVAPFQKMLDKDIVVGLGSDSVASNNTCDLLEEARFALLIARSRSDAESDVSSLTAKTLLETATLGGAKALGLESKVGQLKEGFQADFAVISLTGVHQVPSYDVTDSLIFSSSGRDVIRTVVAGREVYRDGIVTTVDEERLRARVQEVRQKLVR